MHFFTTFIYVILLVAELVNCNALAVVEERSNTKSKVKKLTVVKIVEILKCRKAGKWCSNYLGYYTPTVTKTRTTTRRPLQTITKTVSNCIDTESYTIDTTIVSIGPGTTVTETLFTLTVETLSFAGPWIEDKKYKRSAPTKYPDARLKGQNAKSISKACSLVAHKPRTKTVYKTKTISKTTVTATSCTDTSYSLVIATETAPSTIVFGPGFHTLTVATTTETIPYYCFQLRAGCNTQVPTPCCPGEGTCTDIGLGYPLCAPTDPAEWSTLFPTAVITD